MPVPPDRPIAVVGGGVIGCSTAWHLLKAGARKVTVYDPGAPGGATSSAGAGFISHWSAGMGPFGALGLAAQSYGLAFYRALHDRRGIGCRADGTLLMALTEPGFEAYVRPVLDHPLAPPGLRRLDATEIGEITGGAVDPAHVYGGALNPHGIQIETDLTMTALADEVRAMGGDIRQGVRVDGIETHADGVRLATSAGEVAADAVVLAMGAWANDLLDQLDWRLPLARILATRIVTNDLGLSPTMPTIQCREIPIWIREKKGAFTWGATDGYRPMLKLEGGGPALRPGKPRHPELIDALLERQHRDLEAIFPPLVGAKVESWTQGMPVYTPDGNLFVGPVPGQARVFCAAGDNETGVTHAPGIGRLLGEMVLGQAPFADPALWRLDRVQPSDFPDEAAADEGVARHLAERRLSAVHG